MRRVFQALSITYFCFSLSHRRRDKLSPRDIVRWRFHLYYIVLLSHVFTGLHFHLFLLLLPTPLSNLTFPVILQ